jgi:lysyl-tRNA synthetase class 2
MEDENNIIKLRKEKLKWLISQGIDPYPHLYDKKDNALDIHKKFSKIKKGTKTNSKASVAGRILTSRVMGKASFFTIQDHSGKIQIFATKDTLKNYDIVKKLDHGDIIGVKGIVFKTKAGELTIHASEFKLLCKSLRPLPSKWHGLKDVEIRYRKRYLDLIANPQIKEVFIKRTKIIDAIREFLNSKGFIEVETPILQPIYGGTNARPFKTYLNDLKMNVYLRISNELYLKRLIVGGFEKIFEFSKDFRNEGIDRTHNPEFLQMETMWAYADYKKNMDLTEEMIEYVAKKVLGTTKFNYQGQIIDVKRPWKRMSMIEAIKKFAKIDVNKLTDQALKQTLIRNNLELEGEFTRAKAITLLFEELVEHKLIQPTIIYDFPHETCVLAKQKKEDPFFAERFEPYINGWEIGNSYTEENRPEVLKKEWEKEEKKHKKGDQEAQRMDKDFIEALEIGMPPTSGLGIGIDRLVMLLTNQPSIRDVIFFPFMKQ